MTTKHASSLPFVNPVADSFELMRKMWGFAGLPGIPTPASLASMAARIPQQLPSMMAPTLDVDELERRIADLRAVEQWLELNAGMLRTTIQTLEVQRATIATLKGFTGAMMAPMRPKVESPTSQSPEVALGLTAMKEDESKHALPPVVAPPGAPRKTSRRASERSEPPALAAAALNPVAWWNTLQDQFLRVSASAADAAAAAAQGGAATKSSNAKPRRRATKSRKKAAP